MICYCYCNSPSFFAGAVGIVLFENVLVGLIIYFSILISNFILAFLLGFKNKIPEKKKIKYKINININMLIESINSAAKTLFTICIMIIFYASIISILNSTDVIGFISNAICNIFKIDKAISLTSIMSFIEISKISEMSKFCYKFTSIIAVLGAFGGLCVLSQIVAITSKKISLKKFLKTRPLHLVLSGIICYNLTKLLAKEIVIMTILSPAKLKTNSVSIIPTLCVIIMTFLVLNKKNNRFLKKGVL